MNIFKEARMLLFSPTAFFNKVKLEERFYFSYNFFMTWSFIATFFGLFVEYNLIGFFFFVISLVTVFIGGAIFHIILSLFVKEAIFIQTFKALAYSIAPVCVFSFLLITAHLGILGQVVVFIYTVVTLIWSIGLQVIGLSVLHNISAEKALGIVVAFTMVVFVASIILGFLPQMFWNNLFPFPKIILLLNLAP